MKKINYSLVMATLVILAGCGGGLGGTETGSTDTGGVYANLVSHFGSAAEVLIPEINASSVDPSVSAPAEYLTYGDTELWTEYMTGNNAYVITDVFGSPDEEPRVVTKLRVLIDDFQNDLSGLAESDPDFTCEGATPLDEGDTIEIAFYGEIANGTSDDRYYDCVSTYSSGANEEVISYELATLYGVDESGVVRVVNMTDAWTENANVVEERGTQIHNLSVIMSTYAEADSSESETTTAFLDLQYNQASLYVGVDETADTDDDIYFKSRSRITGQVDLDDDGNPTAGTGDFTVTKYDKGVGEGEEDVWEITTQTSGRGSYGDGEYSLFSVNTDLSSLAPEGTDTFCLVSVDGGLPTQTEEVNCSALETAYAWADEEFPFELDPEIPVVFEEKEFFESTDDDLIASDGSNFSIPQYLTVE
ncbi:MAG: hypothetical protein ACD_62C00154G0001 [uncultured bacterium]|nr:MAG: hypothetical protein ACD_62C00154G0001 [uncultured bacterium]